MNETSQSITMSELKTLILCNLNALWSEDNYLAESSEKRATMIPPLMVWGAPGLGKSTVVREITEELRIYP